MYVRQAQWHVARFPLDNNLPTLECFIRVMYAYLVTVLLEYIDMHMLPRPIYGNANEYRPDSTCILIGVIAV